MEIENTTDQNQKRKKGGIFTFLLGLLSVFILFGTLGGVAYYYFIFKKAKIESLTSNSKNNAVVSSEEIEGLIKQIKTKNGQIKVLKEENTLLKEQAKSITHRLKYVIKPQSQFVAECYSAKIGKWKLPSQCMQDLKTNLQTLLASNKRILVLEVLGVVDEHRYKGRSPELKQEGLASFRAKGVIQYLHNQFPNIATFEGLSLQKERKRGFAVRAYYLQ